MKREEILAQEIARLNLLVADLAVALDNANSIIEELQAKDKVVDNVQGKK